MMLTKMSCLSYQNGRTGMTTSSTIAIKAGIPQGCMLSPFLHTHTHTLRHTQLRQYHKVCWWHHRHQSDQQGWQNGIERGAQNPKNLQLHVSRTKELIVDNRRTRPHWNVYTTEFGKSCQLWGNSAWRSTGRSTLYQKLTSPVTDRSGCCRPVNGTTASGHTPPDSGTVISQVITSQTRTLLICTLFFNLFFFTLFYNCSCCSQFPVIAAVIFAMTIKSNGMF